MSFSLLHPIRTDRLIIRYVEASDMEALFAIHHDRTVTRYNAHMHRNERADADRWFARALARRAELSAIQCAVAVAATGDTPKTVEVVMGTAMLFNFEKDSGLAEIGYLLSQAHWRKGYMIEALTGLINAAFNELGLRRIEATVDARNVASNTLLLRLGFTLEGCLRQRWVNAGETPDVNMFGLLKSDWLDR